MIGHLSGADAIGVAVASAIAVVVCVCWRLISRDLAWQEFGVGPGGKIPLQKVRQHPCFVCKAT